MDNDFLIKLKLLKLEVLLKGVKEYDAPWLKEKKSVCRNEDGSFASCSENLDSNLKLPQNLTDLGLDPLPKNLDLPEIAFLESSQFQEITDNLSMFLNDFKKNIKSDIGNLINKGRNLLKNENIQNAQDFLDQLIKDSIETIFSLNYEAMLSALGVVVALYSGIIITSITGSALVTGFSAVTTGLGLFFMGNLLNSLIKNTRDKNKKEKIQNKENKLNKDLKTKIPQDYITLNKELSKEEKEKLIQDLKTNDPTKFLFNEQIKGSKLANEVFNELEISSSEDLIKFASNLKKSNLDIITLINNSIQDKKVSIEESRFNLPYRMKKLNKLYEKKNLSKKELRLKEVHENILKADIKYGDDLRKMAELRNLEKERRKATINDDREKNKEIIKRMKKLVGEKPPYNDFYKDLIKKLKDSPVNNKIKKAPLDDKLLKYNDSIIPNNLIKDILSKPQLEKRSLQGLLLSTSNPQFVPIKKIKLNDEISFPSEIAIDKLEEMIDYNLNLTIAELDSDGRSFHKKLDKSNSLIKIDTKRHPSIGSKEAVIFHEGGHAVEAQNPQILERSKEFMLDRFGHSLDQKDGTIKEGTYKIIPAIPGLKNFDEFAMEGGFIHPYIGRIYTLQTIDSIIKNGFDEDKIRATEIVSTGLEYIHSRKHLEKFSQKDKDHLLYTLSAIKN